MKKELEKDKNVQTKLKFGQQTALEEIEEKKYEENGLQFYSFNPRMIPDEIDSKPVFRKLKPRS